MQIPSTVRIGSIDYKVIKSENPIIVNAMQALGCCCPLSETITLDITSQGKQVLEQTLLHEICHLIFHSRGMREEYADEDLVEELSLALHQLIKDNPILFLPDEIEIEVEEDVPTVD